MKKKLWIAAVLILSVVTVVWAAPNQLFYFEIHGDYTGSSFSSLVVTGGPTLTRASAVTPTGTYDAGSGTTWWQWTGVTGLSSWDGAGSQTVTVNF